MAQQDSGKFIEPVDDSNMIEVQGPEDIPHFENLAEERAFWATHSIGEGWFAHVQALRQEVRRIPPWVRLRVAAVENENRTD